MSTTLRGFITDHCCNHDPRSGRCMVLDGAQGQTRLCPVLAPADGPTWRFKPLIAELDKPVQMESCGPAFCTVAERLLRLHPAAQHPVRAGKLSACQEQYARGRIPPAGGSLRDVLLALHFPVDNGDTPLRACPTPGCGNPLRPRKRLCDTCAKAARRESKRREMGRLRRGTACGTVNANSALAT